MSKANNTINIFAKHMMTVKFFLPIIIFLAGLGMFFLFLDKNIATILVSMIIIEIIPPFSVEVSIPYAITLGVPPALVMLGIFFENVVMGLFIIWNFNLLKKIPKIGNFIDRFERKCEKIVRNKKWHEGVTIFALSFFMLMPLTGSGSITTAIIGRLVGLGPYKTMLTIVIGSVLGSLIILLPFLGIKLIILDKVF